LLVLLSLWGSPARAFDFADEAELSTSEESAADEGWQLPQAGQFLAEPAAADGEACGCNSCDCCPCSTCSDQIQSAWYTRVEYFHWNERDAGQDYVNEYGVLPTIGYFRRVNNQRLRLEFFGSQMRYAGQLIPLGGGVGTPSVVRSFTNYIGGRAEYDFFFLPGMMRYFEFVGGLGLRIWDRDLVSDNGIQGYHELFVTVYPYVGIETLRNPELRIQPYARARIGVTAFNYEYVSSDPRRNLYPVANITGLCELGLRGERAFVSGYLESFTYKESPTTQGFGQPDSVWFTTGIQFGVYR
jgi:hypothetical protein